MYETTLSHLFLQQWRQWNMENVVRSWSFWPWRRTTRGKKCISRVSNSDSQDFITWIKSLLFLFYLTIKPSLSRNLFATYLLFRIHMQDMSQGHMVVDGKAFWVWSIVHVAGVSGRKRKGTTFMHRENFQGHWVLWAGMLIFFPCTLWSYSSIMNQC